MLYRFLFLVHMCAGFPLNCPQPARWSLRARGRCTDPAKYFCLENDLINRYSENCTVPNYLRPGRKYVLRQGLDENICSSERYQPWPIKFFTNVSTNCIFLKSTCYEEGQLIYDVGNRNIDTPCICDYTRGYDFLFKPRNSCFCVPSEEYCSCYLKTCPNSTGRLSPDYECLKEKKNLTKCKNIIFKRLNATIHENTKDYIKRIEISSKEETLKIELIIFSICSVVIFFVIVISGLYMLHKREPGLNEARNGQNLLHIMENEQPDQNESLYDIYDVIDESQMIDTPLQHIPTEYEDNGKSDSLATNVEINSGDGYLNPYQPMVPDLDHHGYVVSSNTP